MSDKMNDKMADKIVAQRKHGKKKIELQRERGKLALLFMQNGWQSVVVGVDKEMIKMLEEVIGDAKELIGEDI